MRALTPAEIAYRQRQRLGRGATAARLPPVGTFKAAPRVSTSEAQPGALSFE